MSKTISFVASDELADFLSEESERRMTTVSSTAQMLLAEKAREMGGVEGGAEADKPAPGEPEPDALESERTFEFATKREADAVRTQFKQHLSGDDDARLKQATFAEGTDGEVVKELERRSED